MRVPSSALHHPRRVPTRRSALARAAGLAVLTVACAAPAGASAGVVDCPPPQAFSNVIVTSARNMSCAAARRESRRTDSIRRRYRTRGGFLCVRQSGGELGGEWRCVRGSRAFRFSFGD